MSPEMLKQIEEAQENLNLLPQWCRNLIPGAENWPVPPPEQRIAELEERQRWIDEVPPTQHPDDERHWVSAYLNQRQKSEKLEAENAELRDFAIWLTGCGYNFTQHAYFNKHRDRLLKRKAIDAAIAQEGK